MSPDALSNLEFLASAVTVWAVCNIAALDIRGQWAMLAAQVLWGLWAALGGHWFAFFQAVVLFAFTIRALVTWRRAGIPPRHD